LTEAQAGMGRPMASEAIHTIVYNFTTWSIRLIKQDSGLHLIGMLFVKHFYCLSPIIFDKQGA
jgi:hypothetical protein